MKTQIWIKLPCLVFVLLLIITACSKDENNITRFRETQKTSAIGDKVFTGNILQKVFTNYYGSFNFADNAGSNHFAGSNEPGSGSPTGYGNFTYDGISYPLIFGGYDDYDDGWFEIIFADQWFTMDEEPIDINAVGFEIRSGLQDEIAAGQYVFSQSGNAYTFDWGGIGIHINTGQEEFYDFIGGMLSISNSGNNYVFNFSGMLDNGKPVSGYFSGSLFDLFSDIDPNPDPIAVMNAKVNGNSWVATTSYAYNTGNFTSVYGESGNGDYISLDLNTSDVATGASLSLGNGVYGALFGNYNNGSIYYATTTASVYISKISDGRISGNFSFVGQDYISGEVVNITEGAFLNILVNEYK